MGQGDGDLHTEFVCLAGGVPVQLECDFGTAANYFYVEGIPAIESKGLHHGLFGTEAGAEMLDGTLLRRAVGLLSGSKESGSQVRVGLETNL